MSARLPKIFIALGIAALGTTLSWVGFAGRSVSGQSWRGDWVMLLSIATAAVTYFWDQGGLVIPERLQIARVSCGLMLGLIAADGVDIWQTAGASFSYGFFVSAFATSTAMALLLVERR